MSIKYARFDMDSNCVYAWTVDENIILIDCDAVKNSLTDNMYERSELDYLSYNDPAGYVDLILEENPKGCLKLITQYIPLYSQR